jgi:hypothetical protein
MKPYCCDERSSKDVLRPTYAVCPSRSPATMGSTAAATEDQRSAGVGSACMTEIERNRRLKLRHA